MAKLTSKERKDIPTGKFALPTERKYPVNDRSHAANAKSRASQQEAAGNISSSTKSKIDAAANKVLHGRGMRTDHTQTKSEHHFEKSEMPKMEWK